MEYGKYDGQNLRKRIITDIQFSTGVTIRIKVKFPKNLDFRSDELEDYCHSSVV